MPKDSPTRRSLLMLRDKGYLAEVVEKWIPRANIRKDLFGFIDIVAITNEQPGVLGVQSTSGDNLSARLDKIDSEELAPVAAMWLAAGNRIEVHGWRKVGPAGKRKTWQPRIVRLRLGALR